VTAFVFRPSRVKNGKRVYFRMYSGRYRRPGDLKRTTVALHTSDRQVAEAKLRELISDIEKEQMGIAVPKRMRVAAETPLIDHIKAYCADLAAQGCSLEYVAIVKARQTKLTVDCGWKRLIDVTAESFQAWRTQQKLGAKTLNDYLAAMSGLLTSLQRAGLIEQNPLKSVRRCQTRGKERRNRRALTVDELAAVVAVAGVYRLAILTWYYTGLRRAELERLEWGDVQTTARGVLLIPRASTTKNRKSKPCYLPAWLARELIEARPSGASVGDRVFVRERIPSIWAYRTLLKRAGIAYKDDQGKQADVHALRRTMNTHLGLRGVDPQTRQEIMRHSDIRLTLDVYTDKPMLPVAEAIEKLPSFAKPPAYVPLDVPNPDFSGHKLSSAGTEECAHVMSQVVQDEQSLALTGTTEQNSEKAASLGLEPRQRDPESLVLPLHHEAK
jgi:integrase